MPRCPGQDQRFWKPDDIFEVQCPFCVAALEFWKDEPHLKCPQCRRLVVNPRLDLGCAEWCRHASECLEAMEDEEDILCKRLVREVRQLLGRDQQRLDRMLRVLRSAQRILEVEGGDARLVNATAILHDVEETSAVHEVLLKCGLDSETARRITDTINACCSDNVEVSLESRILRDAVNLVNLEGELAEKSGQLRREFIDHTFKTRTGRALATGEVSQLPHDRPE